MTPCHPQNGLMIGPPARALLPALAELLNANLGEGLYTSPDLERDLGAPTARVTGAYAKGILVGGAVARLMVPRDVGYYQRFGAAAAAQFRAGPIGSVEALAVVPAARRRGAGRRLLGDSIEWCRDRGCRGVVAVSWISGGDGTSAPLFAAAGFTMGETIADFYLEESRRNGWLCPVCGAGCHCAGQFVSLRLAA